jgi:glycosyltransferase involved in cell wall biosynthesis
LSLQKPISQPNEIWLLIPAYNVARYIQQLLVQTSRHIPSVNTIVVDDGSSDETAKLAESMGVILFSHQRNMGKGAAIRDGFKIAIENGAKWAITMDGDLQHDPEFLPDFLHYANEGTNDIIIGNRRIAGTKMPLDRRFSNWSSSLLLSLITKRRLLDVQCGYRMFKTDVLKDLDCRSDRYDFETEILLKLIRRGARIGWVEIPTHYNHQPSDIKRWRDTRRFIKIVGSFIFGRL